MEDRSDEKNNKPDGFDLVAASKAVFEWRRDLQARVDRIERKVDDQAVRAEERYRDEFDRAETRHRRLEDSIHSLELTVAAADIPGTRRRLDNLATDDSVEDLKRANEKTDERVDKMYWWIAAALIAAVLAAAGAMVGVYLKQ